MDEDEHSQPDIDAEKVEELWKFFHEAVDQDGKIDFTNPINAEKLSELRHILDISAGRQPWFGLDKNDVKREIQDMFILIALADKTGQGFYTLNLCEYFHKLFNCMVSEVLSRSITLKAPAPVRFRVPSWETFYEKVTTYTRTIAKLQLDWKKRVYFVQFLNYLANHREVHLWSYPTLYRAVMSKLDECETIDDHMSLDWHRKILTRPVGKEEHVGGEEKVAEEEEEEK